MKSMAKFQVIGEEEVTGDPGRVGAVFFHQLLGYKSTMFPNHFLGNILDITGPIGTKS
jgi:hypothetical protein